METAEAARQGTDTSTQPEDGPLRAQIAATIDKVRAQSANCAGSLPNTSQPWWPT